MKNSHQALISSPTKEVVEQASERTDVTILKNNPKIDRELLSEFYRVTEEYERLVAASKGVVRITQGADYNIAHPLSSKKKPTDAYHRGQRVNAKKKSDR